MTRISTATVLLSVVAVVRGAAGDAANDSHDN